ncbi:MAG: ribonuclease III [Arenimonas sp. SCN 70-307]|uniref:ribonuclease III n=1 Tax=Arenimonas sp. SCN 70-307 TaxID=1660089 RepID=UPI000869CD1B|nr:ribonuclease III [Arenimonas sp. SCN 70-307]ODS64855.1 MAG: ribonuclease III [Arenimonas sp. SCN 70-307]
MTDRIGHRFRSTELLQQALRHRSAGSPHNERLEFLGDALVNLVVAEALYERWPKADEGTLTRARASLVRESSLAEIARALGLGDRLELGPGEMKSGGHRRDSILADAVEAIVGAIHLDAGFEACRAAVLPWFEPGLAELPTGKAEKDPKTRLQEWLQARQRARPAYRLVETLGDEHARVFRVACETTDPAHEAFAEGNSLRAAEQLAAERVLAMLESK